MAIRGSGSGTDSESSGADALQARKTYRLRRPRAGALALALTIAFTLSVALAPQAADAAAAPAAAQSLLAAGPSASAAGWQPANPGYATLAGVPQIQSRRIGLTLYCNGETSCRGWFTLVANGLRLVVYRWVGYRRVITRVVHNLLLGAANFEIAAGGSDEVWLTLSSRNARILTEAGGLPSVLAGRDLTAASFEVNLPRQECRPLPPPIIEHGVERNRR